MPADLNSLERFVEAQDRVYAGVCAELAAGRKTSHWMWFVFPQLRALGRSQRSSFYGIAGRAEAGAYMAHPVLGERLLQCTQLVLDVRGKSAHQIFGGVDEIKLCSCMTLFEAVAPDEGDFAAVLTAYYAGERDEDTLDWLDAEDDTA